MVLTLQSVDGCFRSLRNRFHQSVTGPTNLVDDRPTKKYLPGHFRMLTYFVGLRFEQSSCTDNCRQLLSVRLVDWLLGELHHSKVHYHTIYHSKASLAILLTHSGLLGFFGVVSQFPNSPFYKEVVLVIGHPPSAGVVLGKPFWYFRHHKSLFRCRLITIILR